MLNTANNASNDSTLQAEHDLMLSDLVNVQNASTKYMLQTEVAMHNESGSISILFSGNQTNFILAKVHWLY